MATYIFTYRVPRKPLSQVYSELDDAARVARSDAWNGWFDRLGDHVVQQGDAVNDARLVGVSDGTRIGGYSVITAASFDEAAALAATCPGVEWGGGVEIGEVIDVRTLAPEQAART